MEKQEEIWMPIKGYEGMYEISNYGRVKSLPFVIYAGRHLLPKYHKTKIMKQFIDIGGYLYVRLAKLGTKQKCVKIHRLVAEAFIDNPNNYPQVNHKDENKTNNFVLNLEWCTARYNLNYGNRSSKYARRVVMLDKKTNNIIKEFPSIHEAENYVGISHGKISQVCTGKRKTAGGFTWRYVNGN